MIHNKDNTMNKEEIYVVTTQLIEENTNSTGISVTVLDSFDNEDSARKFIKNNIDDKLAELTEDNVVADFNKYSIIGIINNKQTKIYWYIHLSWLFK